MLRAEGDRAASYLRAQGEARSIQKINAAIKASQLTPEVLAYQYLDKLPKLAEGDANKVWMIPNQFGDSLEQFARAMANKDDEGVFRFEPNEVDDRTREIAEDDDTEGWFSTESDPEIAAAVAAANAVANKPVDPSPHEAKRVPPADPEIPAPPFTGTGLPGVPSVAPESRITSDLENTDGA